MKRHVSPRIAALNTKLAATAGLLLAFGTAFATPAEAGAKLMVLVKTGASDAGLTTFDPVTGDTVAGTHLNDLGVSYDFDEVGAVMGAPDGTLRAIIKTGASHAGMTTFDSATGASLAGTHLNDLGVSYDFDQVGAVAFAPDGNIRALIKTGGSHAGVTTFDPVTGASLSGTHLNDLGVSYDFDTVGSIAFAPDGNIRAVIKTGASHAGLTTFDALTGESLTGVHLNDSGVSLDFSNVGTIVFAPDGTLQALVRGAGNVATLATFNPLTGTLISKIGLNDLGDAYDFDEIGTFLYVTLPSLPGEVPEPGSMALLLCGLGVTGIAMRRRRTR